MYITYIKKNNLCWWCALCARLRVHLCVNDTMLWRQILYSSPHHLKPIHGFEIEWLLDTIRLVCILKSFVCCLNLVVRFYQKLTIIKVDWKNRIMPINFIPCVGYVPLELIQRKSNIKHRMKNNNSNKSWTLFVRCIGFTAVCSVFFLNFLYGRLKLYELKEFFRFFPQLQKKSSKSGEKDRKNVEHFVELGFFCLNS